MDFVVVEGWGQYNPPDSGVLIVNFFFETQVSEVLVQPSYKLVSLSVGHTYGFLPHPHEASGQRSERCIFQS